MSLNAQLYKQTAGPDQKWSSFLIKWGCSGELLSLFGISYTQWLDHHHHHHRFIVLVFDNPSEWKLRRTEKKKDIHVLTMRVCLIHILVLIVLVFWLPLKKNSKELKPC